MSTQVLPLFPLRVVLFPGNALPLHIFEPRYKLMIGRCLKAKSEFGVVLTQEGGAARVGCAAQITEVVKKYEDGRLDILTAGGSRFRVLETFEDLPYLQGKVEFLLDDDGPPPSAELSQRLRSLYGEVHRLIHGRPPDSDTGGPFLSFRLAGELPLGLDFKQELLESFSETERQEALAAQLEQMRDHLDQVEKAKRRSAGNGRGL